MNFVELSGLFGKLRVDSPDSLDRSLASETNS